MRRDIVITGVVSRSSDKKLTGIIRCCDGIIERLRISSASPAVARQTGTHLCGVFYSENGIGG